MKRKLFKSMCLAMLLVAVAGYGTEKNAVLPQMNLPKAEAAAKAVPVYEQEYANVVDGVYEFIANGNSNNLPEQGRTGIYEVRDFADREAAMQQLGYTLQDISGDGIPELLIGWISQKRGLGHYGKEIYEIYTFADGRVKYVAEGWSRSSLQLMANDNLVTRGGTGISHQVLAVEHLLPDGNLGCHELYFTWPKDDGLGVYRNMTCRSEADASQETDMTVEEFNEMRSEYANHSVEIEFLPLKDFKKQGFKGLMRQYLSAGR